MSSNPDSFFFGGDSFDRRQQREMQALAASQARTAAALRNKLNEARSRSDSLKARVVRLEAAVIALAQLEDLRAVIENASDAASTRRYARDVLAQIPALGRVASTHTVQVPPDLPDYWLHPAVRSLQSALADDDELRREHANEARQRDPVRSGLFFAAVGMLRGVAVADDDLAPLWPTSDRMSRFQRQIWRAAANGHLGVTARASLVSGLRWVVSEEPALGEVARQLDLGSPRGNDEESAMVALTRLRELIGEITELGPTEVGSDESAVLADIPELLADVINAGAPSEEQMISQIAEIRDALSAVGASSRLTGSATMDEESLSVSTTLLQDLANGDEPGLRWVAVSVYRDSIMAYARELATRAQRSPASSGSVRLFRGVSVDVNADGALNNTWQAQIPAVLAREAPNPGRPWFIAGGVTVLISLLLSIVHSPVWLVLTAIGLGAAAYGWYQRHTETQALEGRTQRQLTAAGETIATSAQKFAADSAAAVRRQSAVPEEVAAIEDLLQLQRS
ncbi:MAG: hypothetical protein ACK5H2_02960 [Beutenbergiaceae bacterium]